MGYEREQAIAEIQEKHRYEDARRMADLRAKVEALPDHEVGEARPRRAGSARHVLALFDGGSE